MEITNKEMIDASHQKFINLNDEGLRNLKDEAINCVIEDFKGYLETLVGGGMQNDFLEKEAKFLYSVANLKWINWEDNRRFLERRDTIKKDVEDEEKKIVQEGIEQGFDSNNRSCNNEPDKPVSVDTQLHSDISI